MAAGRRGLHRRLQPLRGQARLRHANIHPFPSSVDRAHFAQARALDAPSPPTRPACPRPRLGFYGVVDERMDLELLGRRGRRPARLVARHGRPGGEDRPGRPAAAAPTSTTSAARPTPSCRAYLAGWDVALMPFAINESHPLHQPDQDARNTWPAAGRWSRPPITDVDPPLRRPRRRRASPTTAEAFIAACEARPGPARGATAPWLAEVDTVLAELSWDETFARMDGLIDRGRRRQPRRRPSARRPPRAGRATGRPRAKPFDYLIVGAGFAGSVLAERLAAELGQARAADRPAPAHRRQRL